MESAKGFFEQFPFPIPWIVSAALALGASAVVLLPSVVELVGLLAKGTRPAPTHFDAVWEAIWLIALILIAAYVLEALSTVMYQVLESFKLWPKWLRARRRRHHLARLAELRQQYERAPESDKAFAQERLDEYPGVERDVVATRLGNVMRAMETYGTTHYGLDSQGLWYELTTAAPPSLQMELIRSRQSADFFVATFFTSMIFAAAAVITGLLENITGLSAQEGGLTFGIASTGQASLGPFYFGITPFHIGLGGAHILLGLLVIVLIPGFCYRMAIEMVKMWAGAIQALVNVGRIRLADDLHLIVPDSHKTETEMWDTLCEFVAERDEKRIKSLAESFDRLKVKKVNADLSGTASNATN